MFIEVLVVTASLVVILVPILFHVVCHFFVYKRFRGQTPKKYMALCMAIYTVSGLIAVGLAGVWLVFRFLIDSSECTPNDLNGEGFLILVAYVPTFLVFTIAGWIAFLRHAVRLATVFMTLPIIIFATGFTITALFVRCIEILLN